jgi:acyl-CoA reductase-like NAD-dependent aldehyde dehydrogenase
MLGWDASNVATATERQHHVERLLDRIRDRVDELERLRTRGVRGRPVHELEQAIAHDRDRLARVVSS